MRSLRQRPLRSAAAIVPLLLFVSGCHANTLSITGAGRRECPAEGQVEILGKRGEITATYTQISLAGPITEVPEFHDCQRFILKAARTFDSLYAIYASFRLDSLDEDAGFEIVDDSVLPTRPAEVRSAVAAAEIHSWGGTYDSLGILPGFNCLYVWFDGRLRARMVPIGNNEAECLTRYPVGEYPAGKDLEVRPRLVGAAEDDYPPVARWDWNEGTGVYFIGIKCGSAWCEVGHAGFISSAPITLDPGLTPDEVVVRRIKGWYDQQFLAFKDADMAKAQPTALRGTVVPRPGLDTLSKEDFQHAWVPVSDIHVPSPSAYQSKLNLHPGWNELALRLFAGGKWRARITSSLGIGVERDVKRYGHEGLKAATGIDIPGTNRWRWVANDETIWTRCLEGCCEVQGT